MWNFVLIFANWFIIFQVNWPFDCTHASILEVAGRNQFVFPIYDCCRKCEFPTFQLCTTRNRYSPSWLCPSKGMQCIVKCINFNNPYIISKVVPKRKKVPTKSRFRLIPSIRQKKLPVSQKCQRVVRKKGRSCIERLCVPLTLTTRRRKINLS